MLDTIRKYVEAGMGAVSSKRAEQLARGIAKQGQAGKDRVAEVAHEIVEWSKKNGERLIALVRREVKKQILSMGVATKTEVEALKKRVAALEGTPKPTRKTSTAKRASAKRKTTRRSTGS